MNGRERTRALLNGEPVDRVPLMPVVMMLCADRIGVKYGKYVREIETLVDAQVRTAEEFDFDIVATMSDPAREAADCGARVEFYDDQPAALVEKDALLADKARFTSLPVPDPLSGGRMHDAVRSLIQMRERVGNERAVVGWVEGPCADAANLRGINRLMVDFYDDPAFVRDLMAFAVEMGLSYARAQVDVGIDLIGVGDAAASLVGPEIYREFVWPFEKQLVDGLHAMGVAVRLHICGNIGLLLDRIAELNCEIVDIDSMVSIADARAGLGDQTAILGNIDPVRVLRNGTPETIRAALTECHQQAGNRYIVGAGCEVPRDTPIVNVRALTEYARTTATD